MGVFVLIICGFARFTLCLQIGDNDGTGCITGDVDGCTSHIKDTVYSGYQSNAINRKTNRSKYHSQHDHTCTRYSGGSDRCQCSGKNDGQHLWKSELDAVAGSNEDSTDTLVNGCTVHVDCRSQRQYERSNFSSGTELFSALHVDRQSSYRRCTGKCKHDCRKHTFKEFQWT